MVPDGWENKKLGSVAELQRGFDLPARSRINGSVPIISSSGYSGFHNEAKVKAPGIVTGRYGSIGDVFFIPEDFWPLNTSLWVKNFHGNDPQYLYYLLSKIDYKKFSDKTGVPGINRNDLHALNVRVPPLPEQQKIAQILSTWDKAISTTESLIANSQQQKKALMQQLLTGKKRFAGFEGDWEEITVAQFGKVVTGNTPPKSDKSNYGDAISWATAEDFKKKYVSNTKIKLSTPGGNQARIVPKGSVLVTCIASIGKNAIADEALATNQQINAVIVSNDNSNEFFYYLVEFFKYKLIAWAGTTAVPILNKSSFEKLKFKTPSLKEQQKIASVLSSVDQEIDTLQQKLTYLNQEKKALMQQLLTGKRRVKVDNETEAA